MCAATAASGVKQPPTAAVVAESRRCDCRLPPAVVDRPHIRRCAPLRIGRGVGLAHHMSRDAPNPGVHSIAVEEKVPKRRAKRKPATPGVLGTLPASRPGRPGPPRAKPAPGKKPKAGRPGGPPVRPKPSAAPPPRPIGAPRGTELVTTTIRAAGEL